MTIEAFHSSHLTQMTSLINLHIGAVIPGWSLPEAYIARNLQRNPGQYVIDPWVIERKTLIGIRHQRVIAAAHLLRYGTGEEVGEDYRNAGDIAWLVSSPQPHDQEEAAALLSACHDQMRAWNVKNIMVYDSHLPIAVCAGIPDVWTHLTDLFTNSGYQIKVATSEAVFGGWIKEIPLPGPAPVEGLIVRRCFRGSGVSFVGFLDNQEIGVCEVEADLSEGNERPNFRLWAELSYMHVEEEWRSKGVGTWLVRHAMEWLRMAGCKRIVLSVTAEDEERGAGRFYQRFGWQPFTRVNARWELRGLETL